MAPVRTVIYFLIAGCTACGCRYRANESEPAGQTPTDVSACFIELPLGEDFQLDRDAEDEARYFMPDIMGSGAAFLDFDANGLVDVFLVTGSPSRGGDALQMGNCLFAQQSDGSFVDVSLAAGFGETNGYGVGVAVGDIDNDGDLDLYVTGFGGDRLWVNQGDGTFADQTFTLETINERWGTAAAFFDYDRDGWLDLCVVNYLDYFPGSFCDDGSGRRDFCGPTTFQGTVARLFRNLGEIDHRGYRFADLTVPAGLATRPGPGLGLLCRDFDSDGRPDILVANDMAPNALWMQQPDGTFRDEGLLRGIAVNRFGQPEANMGVACADLDGDGFDDVFITTLRGETNALYLGRGGGQFSDEIAGSGLGPPSLEFTGFGVAAIDLENDGDLDLIVVNGRVKRAPPFDSARAHDFWDDYAEPNQMFLNDGKGRFTEASEMGGELTKRLGVWRALAFADIDNDGDFDFLVTNCAGHPRLYRNETPCRGSWLIVRTFDRALNRDAFGATIDVSAGGRRFHREVNPSSSYLSSNDVRVHFGLGDAPNYDGILVRWPDGPIEEFPGGPANRRLVLTRGQGKLASEPGSP